MELHWIIDVDIIGEQHQDVPKQLRALGHTVTTLSATKDFPKLGKIEGGPFDTFGRVYTFHGSFEELNDVRKHVDVSTYGLGPSILRSHYTSYIPKHMILNSDSVMTTWGYFINQYPSSPIFAHLQYMDMFVRPDSGNKTFTGQVIHYDSFVNDIKKLEDTSNVRPETIIWVSSAKRIDSEHRFWISNKKVVASSVYSWQKEDPKDVLDMMFESDDLENNEVKHIVPDSALNLANKVAEFEWQLDRIYVVDIAIINGYDIPKIVEFNSFSCSGLYDCNSEELFRIVSEDIINEWTDDACDA